MILRPFKKIREMKEEIRELNIQIEEMKNKKDEGLCKNHQTGPWYNGCGNLVKEKAWNIIQGSYETKFCKLENPCEDRRE